MLWEQEYIPVGCILPSAVAISPSMHAPTTPAMHTTYHTCPLPCTPPAMHAPLPRTPPAMHAPLPRTPPAVHAPLPRTPPAMHAPLPRTPPAMHAPLPCTPPATHVPCHTHHLPCMPPYHTHHLPCMPPCHAHHVPCMPPAMHTTCHACPLPHTPPAIHAPLPRTPRAMHAPCHAHHLPRMSPAMHTTCHACPLPRMSPAMHTTCHACPLPCMPWGIWKGLYVYINKKAVWLFLKKRNVVTFIVNRWLCYYHPQWSWGKVIFSEACVKNSVHGGVSAILHAGIHPRDQRQTPLPQSRPPPGPDTPWEQTSPGADIPHHSACWDMVNKRVVCILLESILVLSFFHTGSAWLINSRITLTIVTPLLNSTTDGMMFGTLG